MRSGISNARVALLDRALNGVQKNKSKLKFPDQKESKILLWNSDILFVLIIYHIWLERCPAVPLCHAFKRSSRGTLHFKLRSQDQIVFRFDAKAYHLIIMS